MELLLCSGRMTVTNLGSASEGRHVEGGNRQIKPRSVDE